jgi:hypothetical protein
LRGIREWMAVNGRPEKLVVFQHRDWPDFDKLIKFFNEGPFQINKRRINFHLLVN